MSGLCWQQLSKPAPWKPLETQPGRAQWESAGRGRKASWAPRSCSSPAGPQEPRLAVRPLPGPRLFWARSLTGAERRACAFPWRTLPRAVLCPDAAFRRSAAGVPCRTCAPPTRSLSVDTALWRALTAGRYTPWSLCHCARPAPPPFGSLAGAASSAQPMTACVVRRLPALSRHPLPCAFAPRGDGGRVSQAR